jgi:predicted KAP-like P-loop ATPase
MSDLRPLSPDRKLTRIDDDRLGYAPLANHIADVIRALPHDQGLVLAIYAPWGSGKSTFLGFVKEALLDRETAPVILDFNPWWFSGEEDLARRFFEQLALSFRAGEPQWKRKSAQLVRKGRKALSEQIAEFAILASTSPVPFGNYVGMAGQALKRLKSKPKDIGQLKSDIEKALAKLESHILVVVDDVDRLTPDEIRQLFKVIKSVGDFKNVTYVIALDRQVAISALNAAHQIDGHDYLEKIVQASFELPLPDRVALRSMFLEGLASIIGGEVLAAATATSHWVDVLAAIEPFLGTPRNVVSVLNALRISYPLVVGEVSVADFLGTETLHVFMPDVWDVIRRNARFFVGAA